MANPQKRKGSLAERQVADYLLSLGIPCERIPAGASADRGDLWVPVIEFPTIDVKNHATLALAEWVDRANEQAHNAGRVAGVVWHKRRGKTSPADWYVTTSGHNFLKLLGVR
jgi:Holliday junction resolvase